MFFRRTFLQLIVVISLLLSPPLLSAQQDLPSPQTDELIIDEETKKMCNTALINIHRDILKVKSKHKELAEYDKNVLSKNKYGFYTIEYQFGVEDPQEKDKRKTPYAFGLTINGIKDVAFPQQEGSFNLGFSALGLKIEGYQRKHLLRTQYNIFPLIQKYGVKIAWHEQKYLPLRLYLETVKDTYRVREDIEFEVILENITPRHMLVKDLEEKTLYFLFNNAEWGVISSRGTGGESKRARIQREYNKRRERAAARRKSGESKKKPGSKPKKKGGKIILRAGESLIKRFRGESFQQPQEIEIQGIYGMSIKGVKPMGILKIKVAEAEDSVMQETRE